MTKVAFAGGGTGGHLFPALAMARAVKELRTDWQVVFAGSERGVEARILPERGMKHRLFPFQPLHRRQWWRNARWPGLAVKLVGEVDRWLDSEQPDAVVGSGGYVSAPVVWRAARRGIPTAILELDARPGIATRLVARSVAQIWLGSEEARASLPADVQERTFVTGAPITPPDRGVVDSARQHFGLSPADRVLVITGGSQGSRALNSVVGKLVTTELPADLKVIWASGRTLHPECDSYHHPPRVQVVPFIEPMAMAWAVATVAVARAGMMTLAELAAWGIPAILVPLPSAAADHQSHNARAAASAGAALHLPQQGLTPEGLRSELLDLLGDHDRLSRMAVAAASRGRPDAARQIARKIIALAQG